MKKIIRAILKTTAGRIVLVMLINSFKVTLINKISVSGLDKHTVDNITAFLNATDIDEFIDNNPV